MLWQRTEIIARVPKFFCTLSKRDVKPLSLLSRSPGLQVVLDCVKFVEKIVDAAFQSSSHLKGLIKTALDLNVGKKWVNELKVLSNSFSCYYSNRESLICNFTFSVLLLWSKWTYKTSKLLFTHFFWVIMTYKDMALGSESKLNIASYITCMQGLVDDTHN